MEIIHDGFSLFGLCDFSDKDVALRCNSPKFWRHCPRKFEIPEEFVRGFLFFARMGQKWSLVRPSENSRRWRIDKCATSFLRRIKKPHCETG